MRYNPVFEASLKGYSQATRLKILTPSANISTLSP